MGKQVDEGGHVSKGASWWTNPDKSVSFNPKLYTNIERYSWRYASQSKSTSIGESAPDLALRLMRHCIDHTIAAARALEAIDNVPETPDLT